ncbi:MAG: hypothetical protein HRT69_15445 [Flavobacteriaceae bacterium]|nr:hypothetical protein [Flavobacteriaceae bacterium]
MKSYPFYILFIFFISSYGQDDNNINDLLEKIDLTIDEPQKLILLDSVATIMFDSNHNLTEKTLYESYLLAKKLNNKVLMLKNIEDIVMYHEFGGEGKMEPGIKLAEAFLAAEKKLGNVKSVADLHFYLARYYLINNEANSKVVESYDKAINGYINDSILRNHRDLGRIYYMAASTIFHMSNDIKALHYAEESLKRYKQLKHERGTNNARSVQTELLSKNGLYKEAKQIRDIIIKSALKNDNTYLISRLYVDEANDYQMQKLYHKAKESYLKTLPYAKKMIHDLPHLEYYIYSNLSQIYLDENKNQKAHEFIKKLEKVDTVWRGSAEYYLAKAKYLFKENKTDSALFYAKKQYGFEKMGESNYLLLKSQKLLAAIYEGKGDIDNALKVNKSYLKLKDSIDGVIKNNVYYYYQTRYETKKKEATIKVLERDKQIEKQKRKQQMILLSSLVLLTLLLGLFIRYRMVLKNKLLIQEIKNNKQELNRYTGQLIKNNEKTAALYEELEKMKVSSNTSDFKNLETLLNTRLLTNEQWDTFKERFTSVYPNFFYELRNKGLEFSDAEERLLVLEKLNLKPKEMAAILGIANSSVARSKHRLKSKLGIDKTIDLIEFLNL